MPPVAKEHIEDASSERDARRKKPPRAREKVCRWTQREYDGGSINAAFLPTSFKKLDGRNVDGIGGRIPQRDPSL